ncbi:MAG: histidine phosphatase family protein [Chloroflexi bacterium]|nr:histidine phosphatase family protein [Chloroflexota bacterium]
MARVILIRHGESEANRDGRSLGRADSPLTERGRRQVAALGRALAREPIGRVLSSPLRRAADAAAAVAAPHSLEVETCDGLIEMEVGEMEGLPWAEARARFAAFLDRWMTDESATLPMPGGESLADVQRRAWPVIAPFFAASRPDAPSGAPAETTVVVSHNFVIKTLLCAALHLDLACWRRFEADLTGRTVLESRRGLTVLRTLNDVSHLPPDLRG